MYETSTKKCKRKQADKFISHQHTSTLVEIPDIQNRDWQGFPLALQKNFRIFGQIRETNFLNFPLSSTF
jgi:hypothetical protein